MEAGLAPGAVRGFRSALACLGKSRALPLESCQLPQVMLGRDGSSKTELGAVWMEYQKASAATQVALKSELGFSLTPPKA